MNLRYVLFAAEESSMKERKRGPLKRCSIENLKEWMSDRMKCCLLDRRLFNERKDAVRILVQNVVCPFIFFFSGCY